MSRIIVLGRNSQYIESAGTVNQNNYLSEDKLEIPKDVSKDQWNEFLCFMESFLKSKESKELNDSDFSKIENELNLAKTETCEQGWGRFRELFNDYANAITITTPIITYVAANHHQIAQWIYMMFQQ
ncbi:MAG: hypothetical protein FWE05_11955 [Defluviitaleaceae bacterium]|nr:hypothetical protein [Defluviitaleaceae bacterium]